MKSILWSYDQHGSQFVIRDHEKMNSFSAMPTFLQNFEFVFAKNINVCFVWNQFDQKICTKILVGFGFIDNFAEDSLLKHSALSKLAVEKLK